MPRSVFLLFIITFILTSFEIYDDVVIDKKEAQRAFLLLNDIRTNPTKYRDELKLNKSLKITMTKLSWNDKLAAVAEAKAYDMAKKNYFGHTDPAGYGINYYINKAGYKLSPDWLTDKADNSFESIAAESGDGQDAIKTLVIDEGVSSFGHRNHLLGIGEWNASLTDIGIGFVRREEGSDYTTYISVIIAKHNW